MGDDPAGGRGNYSHEVGHTLGLGTTATRSPTITPAAPRGGRLGPDHGAGEARELSQWSRGSYPGADNRQDDLRIITTRNGFGYAADDHAPPPPGAARGATAVKARGTRVGELATGVIGTSDDADAFTFNTAGGRATLRVEVSELGANLDAKLELFDARGRLVGESDPAGELGAELKVNLAAGTYTAVVSGVGNANSSGDDYGSLGWFSLSGLFRNAGSAQAGPGVAVTAQRTLTTSEGGQDREVPRPPHRAAGLPGDAADRVRRPLRGVGRGCTASSSCRTTGAVGKRSWSRAGTTAGRTGTCGTASNSSRC